MSYEKHNKNQVFINFLNLNKLKLSQGKKYSQLDNEIGCLRFDVCTSKMILNRDYLFQFLTLIDIENN